MEKVQEMIWRVPIFSGLQLVLALALAVTFVLLVGAIRNVYFSPLSHIPGPKLAAATDLYFIYWNLIRRQAFLRISDLHEIYGPVVRVAPNMVIIQGPQYIQEVYGKKLDKTPAAAGFTTNQGTPNAFSAVNTEEAQGKRRGMLPHYATSALIPWHSVFDEHVKHLVHVLKVKGSQGPIDALDITAHTLFDILATIVLGDNSANALADWAQGKQSAVVQAVKDWPRRGAYMSRLPKLVWKLLELYSGENWQKIVQSDLILTKYATPLADRARSEVAAGAVPENSCLAHRLGAVKNSHTGELWPHAHVISECIDAFLAGTETTSTVSAYGLWTLARFPVIQRRLQEELDANMHHPDELLPLQALTQLPYLNAVVKETLRLYAPSVGPSPRMVAKEGIECFGYFLPEGTAASVQIWDCHRDAASFGPDPLAFRPERWLQETPAMKLAFVPFSVGARNCPGQNLAMMDLRIVFSIVVRNFNIAVAPGTTEESMSPRELTTLLQESATCTFILGRLSLSVAL